MARKIDESVCAACGICTEICSQKAISYGSRKKNGYSAPIINAELCIDCACCEFNCPMAAIEKE